VWLHNIEVAAVEFENDPRHHHGNWRQCADTDEELARWMVSIAYTTGLIGKKQPHPQATLYEWPGGEMNGCL